MVGEEAARQGVPEKKGNSFRSTNRIIELFLSG